MKLFFFFIVTYQLDFSCQRLKGNIFVLLCVSLLGQAILMILRSPHWALAADAKCFIHCWHFCIWLSCFVRLWVAGHYWSSQYNFVIYFGYSIVGGKQEEWFRFFSLSSTVYQYVRINRTIWRIVLLSLVLLVFKCLYKINIYKKCSGWRLFFGESSKND